MKATDLIEAIQTFLMDILAFFIPGATFLAVTWLLIHDEIGGIVQLSSPTSAFDWLILGLASYISGYVLQGIGEAVIVKEAEYFSEVQILRRLLPGIKRYKELEKQVNESQTFKEARRRLTSYTKTDLSSVGFRELRSIAMSISPGWVRYVYRYTYTWQLCLGTATGLVISCAMVLLVALASIIPASGISFPVAKLLWLIPLFGGTVFLLNRQYRYYSIAMRIPFSIVLADIPQLENQSSLKYEQKESLRNPRIEEVPMRIPKVYLAGGFHSGWQDKVINSCGQFEFYDPRNHGMTLPAHYTAWDLSHIKVSEILFACMDKNNPSGYGLALEIGYAKGLGKTVILVDEKSPGNKEFGRYFTIARETADVSFESLDEGINFLKSFVVKP